MIFSWYVRLCFSFSSSQHWLIYFLFHLQVIYNVFLSLLFQVYITYHYQSLLSFKFLIETLISIMFYLHRHIRLLHISSQSHNPTYPSSLPVHYSPTWHSTIIPSSGIIYSTVSFLYHHSIIITLPLLIFFAHRMLSALAPKHHTRSCRALQTVPIVHRWLDSNKKAVVQFRSSSTLFTSNLNLNQGSTEVWFKIGWIQVRTRFEPWTTATYHNKRNSSYKRSRKSSYYSPLNRTNHHVSQGVCCIANLGWSHASPRPGC